MEPTSPHLVPVPQPAMLELQAWEPSPLPWLAPLLPMLVLSPAAGVPSASKSQLIEWGKRCLEKKEERVIFFPLLDIHFYYHIALSNIRIQAICYFPIYPIIMIWASVHFLHMSSNCQTLVFTYSTRCVCDCATSPCFNPRKQCHCRSRCGSVVHFYFLVFCVFPSFFQSITSLHHPLPHHPFLPLCLCCYILACLLGFIGAKWFCDSFSFSFTFSFSLLLGHTSNSVWMSNLVLWKNFVTDDA